MCYVSPKGGLEETDNVSMKRGMQDTDPKFNYSTPYTPQNTIQKEDRNQLFSG